MESGGEKEKALRALRKKLRHIDGLLARSAPLDEQQRATVARRPSIAAELAALEGGAPPTPPAVVALPQASKHAREEPKASASKRARAAPVAAVAAPVGETCGFCRKAGHRASHCKFGRLPSERVMLCPSTSPSAGCAPRLFVLPMRRCATDFDPATPRAGRVDVGLRCASSALFRSQGLRRNTQVALCFEGEPAAGSDPAGPRGGGSSGYARTITISGGLVRDLRPDELSLGQRLQAALRDQHGGHAGEGEGGGHGGPRRPPAVLVLDGAGEPVEAVCARLGGANGAPAAGGVVVVVGDDRGLTADEERAVTAAAAEVHAPILRVSLGREVLFASHCIVLLQHYLDKLWHGCEYPPGRTYSTSTRTTAARPRLRPEGA